MAEPKPTKENKELGQKIKAIRLSLGKDVRSFGNMVKPITSGSVVSRWERGVNKPNAQRLKSIAELGNVSVDYLLTDDTICEIRNHELDLAMKSMQMFFKSGLMTDEESKTYSRMLHKYGKEETK